MPRNRQDIDRDAKVDEIVTVAKRILNDGDYDALSFQAIADELGLARGALCWYFPSKDDLLVAAAARSGPLSCTKSAAATASSGLAANARRSTDAPAASPMRSRGQCNATAARRRFSAPGAASDAITSSPLARKQAAQLDPLAPVPTTATRLIGCLATLTRTSARHPLRKYHHAARSSVAGWATIRSALKSKMP